MNGLGAIAFTEIDAYVRLTGTTLAPFEIACIRAADRVVMDRSHARAIAASAPHQVVES